MRGQKSLSRLTMVEAFVPSSVGSWHLGHEQTNILKESKILGDKGSLILSRLWISNASSKHSIRMWILLTALYQFCGISSWRMTLPSFGPRYWVVTCEESIITDTHIYMHFFIKITQSRFLGAFWSLWPLPPWRWASPPAQSSSPPLSAKTMM